MKRAQQGVTMVVVLILLTVMLLGGLAMARMTEVGTLASGNAAFRETSLQASEIGINSAFDDVRALADESVDNGNWYYAARQPTDPATGLPTLDFDSVRRVTVGAYQVDYVVDRQCSGAMPVTDPMRQCLLKIEIDSKKPGCRGTGCQKLDPPTTRQFRITARVTGPKGTQVWVQALVTKGQV